MLTLAKFVSESIKEVLYGVQNAKSAAQGAGGDVGGIVGTFHGQTGQFFAHGPKSDSVGHQRYVSEISFDVAVTVSDESAPEGGPGILIVPAGPGSKGDASAASATVSRIRFSVPLILP